MSSLMVSIFQRIMKQGQEIFEDIEDIKEAFQKVENRIYQEKGVELQAMLRAYLRFVIIMLNRNWEDDCTLRHRIAFRVWLLLLFGLVT